MKDIRQMTVEWLWYCKIKSRACFLLVLEFLILQYGQLWDFLVCLKPNGAQFFTVFIDGNMQFIGREFEALVVRDIAEMASKYVSPLAQFMF